MSKGLEALHRIANAKNHFKYDTLELVDKDFQIVQQELLRLEAIDNAKPSEALECLEDLKQECKSTYFDENGKQWWTTDKNKDYRCNTIKQALLKVQEQEKENQELLQALALFKQKLEDTDNVKVAHTMMKQLDINVSLEKENTEYKKVLEIIFEKRVDIWHLVDLLEQTYEMYLAFCESEGYAKEYILTQEEFELVKRYCDEQN